MSEPAAEATQHQAQECNVEEVLAMRKAIGALAKGKKSWFLVDPRTSKHLATWDAFVGLLLCFTALVTPFEVAFLPVPTVVNGRFVVNRIVDIAFVMDMALQVWEYKTPKPSTMPSRICTLLPLHPIRDVLTSSRPLPACRSCVSCIPSRRLCAKSTPRR